MRGAAGAGLDDRLVERLLTGTGPGDADLAAAVTLVRSVASGPAPRPSAALAQLLEVGFEPEVVPSPRTTSRRTWAARVGGALTAAAASLVVAGTAQALPPTVQDGLADLVAAVTPFELPRSEAPDPRGSLAPAGDPTRTSAPATSASPTSASPTSSAPTASAPTAGPSADAPGDEREDAVDADRTVGERRERDRQRAAEEATEESAEAEADAADRSADAEEAAEEAAEESAEESAEAEADAADRSADAARDAARASERAARESARAGREAAEESAERAERDAKDAERDAKDAEDDAEG